MHYGLDSMTVVEKQSMRGLILRGHPDSLEETLHCSWCSRVKVDAVVYEVSRRPVNRFVMSCQTGLLRVGGPFVTCVSSLKP
jgi:hypothetical protein